VKKMSILKRPMAAAPALRDVAVRAGAATEQFLPDHRAWA
jgi:hypothetical protein